MAIFAGNHPSEGVKAKRLPVATENITAITWKRCKIGAQLVIITYRKARKPHMDFLQINVMKYTN